MSKSPRSPLSRALALSPIRELKTPLQKSLEMVRKQLVHRNDLLRAKYIPHSTFDRGVRASKEFRDAGVNGHPQKLTSEEDNTLLQIVIEDARTGVAPSAKKVRNLVCSLISTLFTISIRFFRQMQSDRTGKH
jgi:hypothetical protein